MSEKSETGSLLSSIDDAARIRFMSVTEWYKDGSLDHYRVYDSVRRTQPNERNFHHSIKPSKIGLTFHTRWFAVVWTRNAEGEYAAHLEELPDLAAQDATADQ